MIYTVAQVFPREGRQRLRHRRRWHVIATSTDDAIMQVRGATHHQEGDWSAVLEGTVATLSSDFVKE